jgi:hypothetical protein
MARTRIARVIAAAAAAPLVVGAFSGVAHAGGYDHHKPKDVKHANDENTAVLADGNAINSQSGGGGGQKGPETGEEGAEGPESEGNIAGVKTDVQQVAAGKKATNVNKVGNRIAQVKGSEDVKIDQSTVVVVIAEPHQENTATGTGGAGAAGAQENQLGVNFNEAIQF